MIISSADVDDARVSIWVGGEQKLLSESEARLTLEHQRGGGAHGKSMSASPRRRSSLGNADFIVQVICILLEVTIGM